MASKIKAFKIKVLVAVAVVVALAGLLISFYSYSLTGIAVQARVETNLDIFTGRVMTEIEHLAVTLDTTVNIMNDEHIAIAKAVDYILKDATEEELSPEALQGLADPLDIIELNIANENGILTHSNVPELIGFDYNEFESTRIYITLATRTLEEIREVPRQSVLDGEVYGDTNHYAGVSRTGGGFIQLGFDASVIFRLYDEFSTAQALRDIQIGDSGYGIVMTDGVITAHPRSAMLGTDVTGEAWFREVNHGYGLTWLTVDGERYYAAFKNENDHTVVGMVPEVELYRDSRDVLSRGVVLTGISVAVIVPLVYVLISLMMRNVKPSEEEQTDMP